MKTNGVTFATFSNTGDHILTSAVSAKPVLELKNTNDDATGPTLLLKSDSASPADNDIAGKVVFNSSDDGGNQTDVASIVGYMTDVSNGTEDGALEFNTAINGSTVALLDIAKTAANTVTIKDGDYFFNVASHDGTHGLKLGGTVVTSNAVNINYLSGLSRGIAASNQALVIGELPSGSPKFLQSTNTGVAPELIIA